MKRNLLRILPFLLLGGALGLTAAPAAFEIAGVAGAKIGEALGSTFAKKAAGAAAKNAAKKAGGKLTTKASGLIGKKLGTTGAEETTKAAGKNATWMINAPIALAVGIAYMAKRPNKKEYEALMKVMQEFSNAQGELNGSKASMDNIAKTLEHLSDEANSANEDGNEQIEEQKALYDMYMKSYQMIQTKIDNGEPLTKDEKSLYKAMVKRYKELVKKCREEQMTTFIDTIGLETPTFRNYQDKLIKVIKIKMMTGNGSKGSAESTNFSSNRAMVESLRASGEYSYSKFTSYSGTPNEKKDSAEDTDKIENPDLVIVEDSNSGYQFFSDVFSQYGITCISANGKSNIYSELVTREYSTALVIADGSAFGPETERVLSLKKARNIILYLPEYHLCLQMIIVSLDYMEKVM